MRAVKTTACAQAAADSEGDAALGVSLGMSWLINLLVG